MFRFEKPDYKVKEQVESKFYANFELEPLEKGFGYTIGNALRRVMLSSLPGDAVSSIKIDGVMHEFQTVDGIIEDVSLIVLNIKSIVIKNHSSENKVLHLTATKEGVVTAADIEKDADIEIVNPDQHIATIAKGGSLNMKLTVTHGKGYVKADDNKEIHKNLEVGTIAIDSLYSPIVRVSYDVESARVGQSTNYDKLVMHVETNGAMKPEEAMALASKILIEHLNIVADTNPIAANTNDFMNEKENVKASKLLDTLIEDLDLTPRAHNCLRRANIVTLADLVGKTEVEVQKLRNLGKKSFTEIVEKVGELGLEFQQDRN